MLRAACSERSRGLCAQVRAIRRWQDSGKLFELELVDTDGPHFAAKHLQQYLRYVRSSSKAVAQLHRLGFTHADLKPSNVLYSRSRQRAIVIDFGLSASSEQMHSHGQGTR